MNGLGGNRGARFPHRLEIHPMRKLRLAAVALLSLLSPTATAGVRVVDIAGGAPYTSIQAAVNAAVDGDVILVKRTGNYAGFTIDNKALSIVGDSAAAQVRVNGAVNVTNVTATRSVVLANFDIVGPPNTTTTTTTRSLYAFNNSGQLRVQRCNVTGGDGTYGLIPGYEANGYGYTTPGSHGVWMENCAGGIAFELCTLQGGGGQFTDGLYHGIARANGSSGGDAAHAIDARIALYDCTLTGGGGGYSYDDNSAGDGEAGLHLIHAGGTLAPIAISSNTSFRGGGGGSVSFFACGHVGNGGDGMWIENATTGWILDSTFAGGAPGNCLGGGPFGNAGLPNRNNGSETSFPTNALSMRAPFLVRAQTQSFQLTFFGLPGDQVFLFESDRPSYLETAALRGVQLARAHGPQLQTKPPTPLATIPASGQISVTIPPLTLPPGVLNRTRHMQAYRVALDGTVALGSFAALTVVDPSF